MENRHPTWFYICLAASAFIIAISVAVFVSGGDGWSFSGYNLVNPRTKELCNIDPNPALHIECIDYSNGIRTKIPIYDPR